MLGPGEDLGLDLIRQALKDEVVKNQYPKDQGIAVFDCGKEPDWSWPDYTIVVGKCEIGRHHFDLQIGPGQDATSELIATISTLEDSMAPEEVSSEQRAD